MKINRAGIALVKRWEGLRLTAYRCPAGLWTIGYGHTGPEVTWGMKISADQAERLLLEDLERFEKAVLALVDVPLNENEFSALVSFSYNVGSANLATSTLLRKLNEGLRQEASEQFLRWTRSRGKVLPGLVERRKAERELFLTPVLVKEGPARV